MRASSVISPDAWRRLRRTYGRRLWLRYAEEFSDAHYKADGVISEHSMWGALPDNADDLALRHYMAEKAARIAARADGILVQIGVAWGDDARSILSTGVVRDEFWLVDSWDGRRSSVDDTPAQSYPCSLDEVKPLFTGFNVRFLQGIAPAILSGLPQRPIAFALFSLDKTEDEIASLKILLPKIAKGGVFVVNGYGRARTNDAQRDRILQIAQTSSTEMFVIPTGHALLFG